MQKCEIRSRKKRLKEEEHDSGWKLNEELITFIVIMFHRKSVSHTQFNDGKMRPTAILTSWHEIAQVEANSFFSFKFL